MTRERLAVALALVAVAIPVVAAVVDHHELVASTNSKVVESGTALSVGAGERRCATDLPVPAEVVEARVFTGTRGRPGPPLRVEARTAAGHLVRVGRASGGYGEQPLDIPLSEHGEDVPAGTVCVVNEGTIPVLLAGNSTPLGEVPSDPDETIRVDLMSGVDNRIITQLATVAERASLLKAGFVGGWTLYAGLAALLACGVGGVALVLRRGDA